MSKMPIRILIVTDLEGIIGLQEFCTQEAARQLMVDQLCFGIQIIRQLRRKSLITICDVHNNGQLLNNQEFPVSDIELLQGIPALSACNWCFNCAIMFGFHGMRNSGGRFDHTFRNDIIRIWRENSEVDVGEVSLFFSWIESKGVPVVLVSGEGCFENEVQSVKCLIHKVDCQKSIESLYISLKEKLTECLSSRIVFSEIPVDSTKVYIEVDNKEKLSILAEKGFLIENETFVFANSNMFFQNAYPFANELNKATQQIVRANRCLAKEIKRLQVNEETLSPLLHILSKPIDLIDHQERELIKKELDECEK